MTATPILIHGLEPRLMLYSFVLTSGVLSLTCDPTSQDLSVSLSGTNIQATLTEAGVQKTQQHWTASSVTSLHINLDAGDDRCTISSKIKVQALIAGGDGNDTITSGGGNDYINGNNGNDIIDAGGGSDTVLGGNGFDIVDYSSRTNPVFVNLNIDGGDGEKGESDFIHNDITGILGGSGADVLVGSNNGVTNAYIRGNDGNDTITGTELGDTLYGGDGNDLIFAGGGRDLVRGGNGKDILHGGAGNDTLFGDKGIDHLYGEKAATASTTATATSTPSTAAQRSTKSTATRTTSF